MEKHTTVYRSLYRIRKVYGKCDTYTLADGTTAGLLYPLCNALHRDNSQTAYHWRLLSISDDLP